MISGFLFLYYIVINVFIGGPLENQLVEGQPSLKELNMKYNMNMDQNRLMVLMTSFLNSQFQYCPLAWMFHRREISTKLDKLLERARRIAYRDQESSFKDLLGYGTSASAHRKNLRALKIEVFKTEHGLNPPFIKEIFCPQTNQYNLRNDRYFNLPRVRSVMYGSETARYGGPQLMVYTSSLS